MLARRAKLLLVLTLSLGLGLHWAFLQGVAWTGMILSRSGDMGLRAAVESTFSGEQPCPLCKAVEAGQKASSERTPALEKAGGKLDGLPVPAVLTLSPLVVDLPRSDLRIIPFLRFDPPPTPPPPAA